MTIENNDREWLAAQFEANRPRLQALAYRLLGSSSEADDAVQESWLRLSRAGLTHEDNIAGWLTTVVARVCLDMLRSRKSRREEFLGTSELEPLLSSEDALDPEDEAVLSDSVGVALLVVLETLNPAERLAFVLHDIFAVSFDEIAPIVGRTPTAARQLASRARRRVRGAATDSVADHDRQRGIVEAFLAASRGGDFEALLTLLDPEVVYRADVTTVLLGSPAEIRGGPEVARQFAGRARAAQVALVNGVPGLVWAQRRQPRVVFNFTIKGGQIVEIELIGNATRLAQLDLTILKTTFKPG